MDAVVRTIHAGGGCGRRRCGRAVVALVLALVAGAAGAADRGRYVVQDGAVLAWDGAAPEMDRVPQGVPPTGPGLRRILEAGDHLLLVLASAPPEAASGRKPREGEARVFDTSVSPPRLVRIVPFEGEPLDGVVQPETGRAFILATRPATPKNPVPRAFLHALDLATGGVADTATQAEPVAALALDPGGTRLYASQADSIQSFTLRPLVASWRLRSPGPNGPLAIQPGSGTLCVARGQELALFDPAVISRRDPADRHNRTDDASGVLHLPFRPDRLDISRDGHLALASAPGNLVFVDLATQALVWPGDPLPGLREAVAALPLAFPGVGHDLIVALLPSGAVNAVRTPGAPTPAPVAAAPATLAPPAQAPPAGAPPVPASPAVAPPAAAPPQPPPLADVGAPAAPNTAPAGTAPPAHEPDALAEHAPARPPVPAETPAAPVPAAPKTPAPAQPEAPALTPPEAPPSTPPEAPAPAPPAFLTGRVTGAFAQVKAVVLYGPNSIIREFARVRPETDGTWSAPLPPPGAYRIMVVGDGSTPLPVQPGFRSLTVAEGIGQAGLDFDIRPAP